MSSNTIALPSDKHTQAPATRITQSTAVEQARAVAEVQAAVVVAQQCPRDVSRAIERMRQACSQKALADRAFYSLPRAGGKVEGSTVHLARELAACWGNVDYGIRELRRDDEAGESEMSAWAWDQETNVRSSRSFIVPHAIMATDRPSRTKFRKSLTDLGDIANNNNSVAARAVRETIFTVLPVWFRVEAEDVAAKTLAGGASGTPLQQQVADAIAHFERTYGVTGGQIEERLQRPRAQWTPQDLAALRVLASEFDRGEKHAAEEFPREDRRVTAEEVAAQSASRDAAEGAEQ